ncbi:hypothetical protein [Dickeya lacustris]|uniref:Uncharacterized protein n=1 Tax=Dickeya lacustris TaxID=2259638 RepID=A0ABY8G534_9GAMM|nr:hypothetical protein [Dickeya lacustris]WFN55053.1 hypothetical protein O1Q98_15605 [Dickeya lacustris]
MNHSLMSRESRGHTLTARVRTGYLTKKIQKRFRFWMAEVISGELTRRMAGD